MQRVHGVQVDTSFEAQQSCIPLRIGIRQVALLDLARYAMREDIVVDAIGKERQLCRHMARGEVESEVSLQTVFRLQLLIAQFVADRAFVHAVRRQFTHVRRTEAARQVQAQVEVVVDIADSSDTSRQTVEVAREILKAQVAVLDEFVAMQSAVIVAHAPAQCPALP